ncbi:hypothetical protein BC833DRAFT_662275 [Globomyces pollinis-pini]|nr:hypothetical protein BC833DRAFT_662275 [Globomyces pollinis-pini]
MTELFIPPDFRFLIDIASIGFLGSSIIANVGLMVYLGWGKLRHCHLTKFILTYNFVNLISTLLLFAECFVPINVLGFQILRICHNTLPLLAAILGFELLKLLSVLMTSWTENTFRKIQYMTIILHTIFTLPNYFNFYIKTPMLKHWGTFGFGIFALSMIMSMPELKL